MGLTVVTERPEDMRVSLGARTGVRDGELTILTAERDGPAAAAGLSAGDRLVAVDGLRCTEARLKTLLARKAPGETVLVAAFRRDELLMATVELTEAPGDDPAGSPTRSAGHAGSLAGHHAETGRQQEQRPPISTHVPCSQWQDAGESREVTLLKPRQLAGGFLSSPASRRVPDQGQGLASGPHR